METIYLLDINENGADDIFRLGCEVRLCHSQRGVWRCQSTVDSLVRLSYVHFEDLDLNDLPRFNHYTGNWSIDSWMPPKTSYQVSYEKFQDLLEMNRCRQEIARQHYHDMEFAGKIG